MAQITLFRPVNFNVAVLTAAGSGNVVRATYTVPASLRAEVSHSFLSIDPSAALVGTVTAFIDAIIGGTAARLHLIQNGGVLASVLSSSYACTNIPLQAGDSLTLNTGNASAANVNMRLTVVIREYQ